MSHLQSAFESDRFKEINKVQAHLFYLGISLHDGK